MVVEIPKGETAKMEISKDIPMNPIKQDVKKGKLRYVNWPYPCNYGAFPQTWEYPSHIDPHTQAKGDNDPVDVCDISDITHRSGEVVGVKILGTYAMIDEGETDWKVICVDVNDRNAHELNDINDIERVYPGKLTELFAFLKFYKTPVGSPPNTFAFDGQLKDRQFALTIIEETHHFWRNLITGSVPNRTDKYNIQTSCTVSESPYHVNAEAAEQSIIQSYLAYVRGTL